MNPLKKLATGLVLASSASLVQAEFAGNITVANNYIWRGLTQTMDEAAVSGGLDWSHESGFYVGTWVSNVEYAQSGDTYSYEHDIYTGFAGSFGSIDYDVSYLYYNYNEQAEVDFGEIYASLGYMGFSISGYVLAHTQADEGTVNGRAQDFGFGEAYYISLDYGFELPQLEGWEFGLHGGYHDGDFVEFFNFGDGQTFDYMDWAASIGKGGFGFMVSGTDIEDTGGQLATNNDALKFTVSYSLGF